MDGRRTEEPGKQADPAEELAETKPRAVLQAVPNPEHIMAKLCPDEHPNDPESSICWVCEKELGAAASIVEMATSTLGRLLFEDGTAIDVAHDLAIGRSPIDEADGLDTVTVSGPQVSRRHLVLEARGWQLFIRDCGSTNGTFLTRRGEKGRRRVPTDESIPVRIGDSIHFGSRQALVVQARPS